MTVKAIALKSDVVIIGGGLAGLTLALQIKQANSDMDISVIERKLFPVPEKTAKVGESTVEIGSRYLKTTLGLEKHFSDRHLRKHGLRCFFGAPQDDFSAQDELGVSQLFGIPTYQIDRGAIENHLQAQLRSMDVSIIDGAQVADIDISGEQKTVDVDRDGQRIRIQGQWLVDSAGRCNFLKSALDLSKDNNHKGNAVWFRVDKQIKLDTWSSNPEWQQRVVEKDTRWLSTNHLMGPGYWVWIIPLDNGATSFGIVMDDEAFSSADFSNYAGTIAWLREHHPRCAAEVESAELLDFVCLQDYSHSCKQLFSDQGWGVTGEAGVFADPFYSPGSDFIAFGNSFMTDLIGRWKSGNDIRLHSRVYDQMYQSFFASTLSLYEGNYGGFGDRRMMSLKLVWDYAYYWGVLSVLYFRGSLTDIGLLRELAPQMRKVQALNSSVQDQFRERAKMRAVLPAQGLFINQYLVPCLKRFSSQLDKPTASTREELLENIVVLERLAGHIGNLLSTNPGPRIGDDERELLGEYRHAVLA
ncbi:MAG: NAD(P)/FAD-dependent oxidoreductase [Congregibacter sp.]